jgi:hypothetical protein
MKVQCSYKIHRAESRLFLNIKITVTPTQMARDAGVTHQIFIPLPRACTINNEVTRKVSTPTAGAIRGILDA